MIGQRGKARTAPQYTESKTYILDKGFNEAHVTHFAAFLLDLL